MPIDPKTNVSYTFKLARASMITSTHKPKYFITILGSPTLWDYETGKKVIQFVKDISNSIEVCVSDDDHYLAVKNTSGRIALYDLDKLEIKINKSPTKIEGNNLLFTPDNRYVVSSDWEGNAYAMDCESGEVQMLMRHGELIEGCPVHNSRYTHYDKKTQTFYLVAGGCREGAEMGESLLCSWKYPFDKHERKLEREMNRMPRSTYNEARNLHMAAQNYSSQIFIYDDAFNLLDQYEPDKKESLICANWYPNGEYMVIASRIAGMEITYEQPDYKDFVRVVRYSDRKTMMEYSIRFIHDAKFTPDGKYLLVAAAGVSYCIDVADFLPAK